MLIGNYLIFFFAPDQPAVKLKKSENGHFIFQRLREGNFLPLKRHLLQVLQGRGKKKNCKRKVQIPATIKR